VRLYLEDPFHKNRAGGVAQGESPEFTSHYCKKEERKKEKTSID
jgi:hypothetical protein